MCVYVFACVHLPRYTLPDATNHHRSLMTDVTGHIRRAGEMNYNVPRGDAYIRMCVCVGKFIYLSETPKGKIISRRSRSVSWEAAEGRGKLRERERERGILDKR